MSKRLNVRTLPNVHVDRRMGGPLNPELASVHETLHGRVTLVGGRLQAREEFGRGRTKLELREGSHLLRGELLVPAEVKDGVLQRAKRRQKHDRVSKMFRKRTRTEIETHERDLGSGRVGVCPDDGVGDVVP